MQDTWMRKEWNELRQRVMACATHWGSKFPENAVEFRAEADEFQKLQQPKQYPDLLERVRQAVRMAVGWSKIVDPASSSFTERNECITCEIYDQVDEAGRESFPASDPPAWTVSRI